MERKRKTPANGGQVLPPKHDGGCPEDAVAPTTLVTTSQAARIAGVSPSTIVRNRAKLGAIPGPNGAYLFNTQIIVLDLARVDRRASNGADEVRISTSVAWGRLPEKRSDGITSIVSIDLFSEWVAADSVDGRELLAARHPARPLDLMPDDP